jgi:hypothetical protein
MNLSRGAISVAALGALLGAIGMQSDVQAGQTPALVSLSNGNSSCNASPGGTCNITPSANYTISFGNLPFGPVLPDCCANVHDHCYFQRLDTAGVDTGVTTGSNVFGSIVAANPFTFQASATQGQPMRYQIKLVATCSFTLLPNVTVVQQLPTQTAYFTYTVTN